MSGIGHVAHTGHPIILTDELRAEKHDLEAFWSAGNIFGSQEPVKKQQPDNGEHTNQAERDP